MFISWTWRQWVFCFGLLFLLSCNATFEGEVKLKKPGQKIPLLDKQQKEVFLDHGPNELRVRGDSIGLFVDGIRRDFVLPPGMKWDSNFYFMGRQIQQPVDVKGFTTTLESDPYEVVERQSCDMPKSCESSECRQYYWVKSTYKKISKKFILEFHRPLDQEFKKIPRETMLGHFAGLKTSTSKSKIKEEKLSDCLLPSDERYRELASEHQKTRGEKETEEKRYPAMQEQKSSSPKGEPGGGDEEIL